jgi:2-haloalkanoic acid dehalogenase type II
MALRDYDVLSFDCYGTLINWESGLYAAFAPLLTRAGVSLMRDAVLEVFAQHESAQQAATPNLLYSDLLAEVHGQVAEAWGVARDRNEDARFGNSIGDWPAFPDTAAALQYLKQHYRLIILSNVDRQSFSASNARLGVTFDAIYTAQDIGSYKPDRRNFIYLIDRLAEQGIRQDRLLHVAQSLFHDHVTANALGLASAWIDRRGDAGGSGATAPVTIPVRYDYRFPTLGSFADAHRSGTA